MKYIELTKGKKTIINDQDFKLINKYKWCFGGGDYAMTWIKIGDKKTTLKMHRLIINAPKGMEVDHINNNRLDNRRENLRLCNRQQNSRNSLQLKDKISEYRGVTKVYNKYVARITLNYKVITIGYFEKEHHAAMAYDIWAKELFGEFAKLNF